MGLMSTPQGDETQCVALGTIMNTIKYVKTRIYKELSKLRAGLNHLRFTFNEEPEIHSNIIISWGEICDIAGGLVADGSCVWHKFYKHIVNVGIPAVLFSVRTELDEELLEGIRHRLRVINSLARQFIEHVEQLTGEDKYWIGAGPGPTKTSWNPQ